MPKTRVLVCGATGFIGRNVAERLAQRGDMSVRGVYLRSKPYECPGVELVKADLTDPEDVRRVFDGVDVVVQAAAATSGAKDIVQRPYLHVTDNAVMSSHMFRAAFEQKVRHVLYFSCTVMYPSSETPLKESDFDAGRELYPNYFGVGWTKIYLEKMCEFYSRIGDTRYTIIRHSNVYGPHDKFDLERSHVFGATMTKVLTASDKITVWGSGEEARDLIYVSDLCDFVESAVDKQESKLGLYNVGAGRAVAIKDLVGRIVKASGKELKIEHDLTKPTLKTSLCLDCSKAETELGWKPKTSLEEGIRLTLDWYRKNLL